jgi:uncharacterized protein YdcH (DUF465 family)
MDRNNPHVRSLLDSSEEFRLLFREHEELEGKLAALDSIHYLTPEQELERRQLQKVKLRGRDRMELLIHQAREGSPPA